MSFDRSKYLLMGIDPGTNACGWAIGNLDGAVLRSGSIVYAEKLSTEERVFRTAEKLAEIGLKYSVQCYYCEAPLVFLGAKTALVLAGLSWVIHYVIWKHSGLNVNYIESSTVRSKIGVPGIKRPGGEKLKKGQVKANALRWIRGLMDDMGLPYDTSDPVPLGEEDRLEAIAVLWAGCSEISAGMEDAIADALAKMKKAHFAKEKKNAR